MWKLGEFSVDVTCPDVFKKQILDESGYFQESSRTCHNRGIVTDLRKFENIFFDFPPCYFNTHSMYNWVMMFKQKRIMSSMYLHFNNKKDFGFRVVLPQERYPTVKSIFEKLDMIKDVKMLSSDMSTAKVIKDTHYVYSDAIKETVKYIPTKNDMETALKTEQVRIKNILGDYRGSKTEYPDNVIDFSEYLHTPKEIQSTDEMYVDLIKQLG